ncbi:hypothetical protein LCGC14_1029010 [marine sediment metagenome]|uniref:Uncharacterized protein n=1 Tax=marine sediment metagenome TaxID=412755 RepID=A0A0F9NGY5_9ZZZZ
MDELTDFLKKSIKKRIIETKLQDLKNKSSKQKKFIKINKGDILY